MPLLLTVHTVLVSALSVGATLMVTDDEPTTRSASPAPTQETRNYPGDATRENTAPAVPPSPTPPPAPTFGIGDKATNSGASVIVNKIREGDSYEYTDFRETKTKKAPDGAKYVIVETTVFNDGSQPFDPVCGGGISMGLVDDKARTFNNVDNVYKVKGNGEEACLNEVQPGFKRDAVFAFMVPADAKPAAWAFSGDRNPRTATLIRVAGTAV
ncbi:hypothetical protein [Streptomyces sp. NPDC091371]|uniref:hypothetical protein n=1 Tax=Streptomyces sp. NPDC091371 TaxID=3155303 RepID=UPI00341709F6